MPADQPTLPHTTTPTSPPAVALIDPTLRIRQATPELAALVGMPAADLPGLPAALLIPDAAPALGPLLATALASGEPSHNVAVSAPDGQRWLLTILPIRSQAGVMLGGDLLLSRYSGQPALRLGEAAGDRPLHVSEVLLRRLADNATFGVLIGRRDGTTMYVNAELRRMLGYDAGDFPPTWMAITPPGYEQRDAEAVAELKRSGVCLPYEKEYLGRDGRRVPVMVGAAVIDGSLPDDRLVAAFVIDLSALKRAEAARQEAFAEAQRSRLEAERAALAADEALALLDTVIDSAPIGLAFMDAEFRYRRVNATLARLNGLPAAEHIGRRARDLFPRGAAVWEPYWRQVVESGEPIVGLELGGPAMGIDSYALVDYYPVHSPGGELLGVGIIVQDITGRRQAEQERQQLLEREQAAREAERAARAHAEEAVQLRDTFLSVAAHELKTPLTSLLGQAQLLRRRLDQAGDLNEANQRSLGVVVGQAQRLNQLINDLLDGARLEAGQLIVNRVPLDLGGLIRQVADDLHHSLVRHRLVVQVEGEPLVVAGDSVRLEQVVQNLLNNAVKYSPNGGVVGLRAARDGDAALLTVSDHGIGIEEAALPRLFERFYRAPGAERAQISGVGVGLYVVREIVRQHGGTITVESAVGQGTTITVRLPLGDG